MGEKKMVLSDLAATIRSKNAGPFVLTLDVFFKDENGFRLVRESGKMTKEEIATLYQVNATDILEITFFEPAHALKISMKRWIASAVPGDTDVFGAQQHLPLMEMEIDNI